MSHAYENLTVAIEDRIGIVTINGPQVRNALDRATSDELWRALEDLAASPDAGVMILTGAGEKAFVSGTDIRDLQKRTKREALQATNARLFSFLEQRPPEFKGE